MPFQTGHKNGKGRPKGSKNRASLEVKEIIQLALNENQDKFLQEFNALTGLKFVQTYMQIAEYILPKARPMEEKPEARKPDLFPNLAALSPDELDLYLKLEQKATSAGTVDSFEDLPEETLARVLLHFNSR